MVCVIGSRSTSSSAWGTYKTAPVKLGHLFSPAAKHHRCHAVSLHPDLAQSVAKDKETSPPPPEEEPELEVHHTGPVASPKFRGEGSPSQHHVDAAPDLNSSRVRTPFIPALIWTHPHLQPRSLAQARCDSDELMPWSHGSASRMSCAAVTSLALDPSRSSRRQQSRLDQSHTPSPHKILAFHLGFNGSE
jgi:hypothetical protein